METQTPESESSATASVKPRAFVLEFRNAWQTLRFVVVAPDVWQALTAAEKELERTHDTSEYPYRPILVKEIDAQLHIAPGVYLDDINNP